MTAYFFYNHLIFVCVTVLYECRYYHNVSELKVTRFRVKRGMTIDRRLLKKLNEYKEKRIAPRRNDRGALRLYVFRRARQKCGFGNFYSLISGFSGRAKSSFISSCGRSPLYSTR